MKQVLSTFVIALLSISALAQSETATKTTYFSGGSEIAFSAPVLDVNGSDQGANIRFAPVVNVQQTLNKDMSKQLKKEADAQKATNKKQGDIPDSVEDQQELQVKKDRAVSDLEALKRKRRR